MIQLSNLTNDQELNADMIELSDQQTSNIAGGKLSSIILSDYDTATKASDGYVNGYEKAVREILTKDGVGGFNPQQVKAYEQAKANDGGVQTGEAYWIRSIG
jgi:hypothetical protein